MSNFQYLFTPLKIGSQVLPNRIIVAPHSTNFPRGSEQEIAYYSAKAKGGAGTIVLESTVVLPTPFPCPMANLFTEEGVAQNAKTI